MKNTLRVAVLFGGQSAEHEVSLQSARNVIASMDRSKYEVVLIGIAKDGRWFLCDEKAFLDHADDPQRIRLTVGTSRVVLLPGGQSRELFDVTTGRSLGAIDVAFPVLHGPFGEDGTVQGALKLAGVPCVGAGVVGSAIGMDKDVMKRLLREAGVPTPRFLVFRDLASCVASFPDVRSSLGLPVFVKPANLGSSVGISKVKDEASYQPAAEEAFLYDDKILVEEGIQGREIECSVLGNETPLASIPGEIIPQNDFYSYDAKYIDDAAALLRAPADLDQDTAGRVQSLAVRAFQVLCCEGMARVDFFLKDDGQILVNEINTIPGFTRISMYPRLWSLSGIPGPDLVDRLIQLALDRGARQGRLRVSREA